MHGGSKRANALYGFFLVSKKLKIQSSDNASYFRAEGEDFCGTLRLDPKNIPLPLFNFKLHLSTVSLIGNWVECARRTSKKTPFGCELVLNWFSHYSRIAFHYSRVTLKNYINYLFHFFHRSSFLRKQESRMYFVSLTAIKLWVQGVCQKRHPLGARRQESRKPLLTKNDKQNLRKDCMSCAGQPSMASADLFRPWVGACTDTQSFLKTKLSFLVHGLSFLRQSSLLRQLSFPRRRESRKSLFSEKSKLYGVKGNFFVRPLISLYRGWQVKKPSSKAQTCGLPQSVSCQLTTLCQIRTRFEHGFFTCLNNKALIKKSPLPPYLKLFLHPLPNFALFTSSILKKGFLYA